MAAKCPKCEKLFSSVKAESIKVKVGTASLPGVAYTCPFCFMAISVTVDPIALKSDTVKQTVKALKGG